MAISNRKKALLHVAKTQLGLDDDDYRTLLERVVGVRSSREMSDGGFARVMDEMERLGFRSSRAEAGFGHARHWQMATDGQLAMIRDLWRAFTAGEGTDASLDKWLRNRFRVGALRMLDGAKARKVIAALLDMNARRRAAAIAGPGGDNAA